MNIGKTRTNQPVEGSSELDAKLVNLPLPATTGQGGKVLGVKEDGSGYELKSVAGVSHLYCHPIHITGTNFEILLLILDNQSSGYTKSTFWTKFLNLVVDNHAFIAVDGFYKDEENVYYTADMLWNYQTSQLMIVHSPSRIDNVNFAELYNDENTIVVDGVNQLL